MYFELLKLFSLLIVTHCAQPSKKVRLITKCTFTKHPKIFYKKDILFGQNLGYGGIKSLLDCAGHCMDVLNYCKGATYLSDKRICVFHRTALTGQEVIPPNAAKYESHPNAIHMSVHCENNSSSPGHDSGGNVAASTKHQASIISDVKPTYIEVEWLTSTEKKIQSYSLEYKKESEKDFRRFGDSIKHDGKKKVYKRRITDLNFDTKYIIKIIAVDSSKSQEIFNAEARTKCLPPTSPPSNIELIASSASRVSLKWTVPPQNTWRCSAVHYETQYHTDADSTPRHADIKNQQTEHTFDASPGTTWTVQMRTVNKDGQSDLSPEVKYKVPTNEEFWNVKVEALGPDKFRVSWDFIFDTTMAIKAYIIMYELTAQSDCSIASGQVTEKEVSSSEKSTEISGLAPASTVRIEVKAKTALEILESDSISVTTEESEPTGPPRDVGRTILSSKSATIFWDKPECKHRNGLVTGYQYKMTEEDSHGTVSSKSGVVNAETILFDDLVPTSTYTFHIEPMNAKGICTNSVCNAELNFSTKPSRFSPPTELRIFRMIKLGVLITFLYPIVPNGVFGTIDEYKARFKKNDEENWNHINERIVGAKYATCRYFVHDSSIDENKLCTLVDRLVPGKYSIQISAHTSDYGSDWGEWSDLINVEILNVPRPDFCTAGELSENLYALAWKIDDESLMQHCTGFKIYPYSAELQETLIDKNSNRGHGGLYLFKLLNLHFDTEYKIRITTYVQFDSYILEGDSCDSTFWTSCGKPDPPTGVSATKLLNTITIEWTSPPRRNWRCSKVEYRVNHWIVRNENDDEEYGEDIIGVDDDDDDSDDEDWGSDGSEASNDEQYDISYDWNGWNDDIHEVMFTVQTVAIKRRRRQQQQQEEEEEEEEEEELGEESDESNYVSIVN